MTEPVLVGTRIPDGNVPDLRDRLTAWAAMPGARIGIATAYIAPETFGLLDALTQLGDARMRVVIAANKQSRPAWEAAKVFRSPRVEVRLLRAPVGSVLHVKVYVARLAAASEAIVGSSNFTPGGVRNNVELNVLLHEANPASAGSPVSELHRLFDDMFRRAMVPTDQVYDRLIASSPAHTTPTPGLGSGVTVPGLPDYGATAASVGPDLARGPVAPADTTLPARPGYITLLVQLSEADVNRPAWRTTGHGTAQLNLPREAADLAGIPPISQVQTAEAVGVGAFAGMTRVVEASFWQREPRGPGRVPEAIRFTFRREYADFISGDIGPPTRGDVLVLEIPSAIDESLSPIRMAVVPERQAIATGLMPTQFQRGTVDRDLHWEPRPGTVL